jgi:hypothetical protein
LQDFTTILRDPMVRTILAIAGLCITVGLFLAGRRRKRLSYLVSNTRVLGVHEELNPSRVQILFDGAPVTEVDLAIININNWGNEPIRAEDFERPLRFRWNEPARILSAEVIEVTPPNLQPKIKASGNEIVLDPLLLNQGDQIRIKALINRGRELSVDARIVGVKRVTKRLVSDREASLRADRLFKVLGSVCVGAILLMLAGRIAGFWVADGRAEQRIAMTLAFVIVYLLLDELKRGLLELFSSFKKKDRSK